MPLLPSSSRSILSLNHPSLFHLLPSTTFTITGMYFSSSSSSSSSHSSSTNSKEDPDQQKLLLAQVLKYHNQTKHSFINYAKGPRGLDWANQPNPFRRFDSSQLVPLLHPQNPRDPDDQDVSPLYSSLFLRLPPSKPISVLTISQLFYDSLALSAWKSTGFSTWPLRVNPSSGNLHPTEAYIIAPPICPVLNSPFVAHYAPKEHSLEVRATIPSDFFPKFFPENSFLIGFSSIFWREAWKYGERAFRYCNHDVGHAIAAVSIAAAALGWDVKHLDGLSSKDLKTLMGLDKEFQIPSRSMKGKFPEIEFEHPECVLVVFPNGVDKFDVNYEDLSYEISKFSQLEWKGNPNLLSKEHFCWDIIYRTAEVVEKPLTNQSSLSMESFRSSKLISEGLYKNVTVRELVRKRRSAVDMDGVHVMEREAFYQMLLHCLPSGYSGNGEMREKQGRQKALPFRVLSWDAQVHAVLFVHRVEGLSKGLYFLVRNEDHFDDLKKGTSSDFKWEKPEGCPEDLPLYELARGDCQLISKKISCHQDIAADGCFSLGMVAHFEPTLRDKKVWMYPRLFWETGVLGHILYLEAHAIGISATGIGCYFDDAVHEILGLTGSMFQSLYHFTVGAPILDKRIMSLPAYPGPVVDP